MNNKLRILSDDDHVLRNRAVVTVFILIIYFIGRSILVFGVDTSAFDDGEYSPLDFMYQMVSGDRYRSSVMALGITPNITASIILSLIVAMMGSDRKSRISPKKMKRLTYAVALGFAVFMAWSRAEELQYRSIGMDRRLLEAITVAEMTAGAALMVFICQFNKDHGIGGQTTVIMVNIIDGQLKTLNGFSFSDLRLPMMLTLYVMILMLVMENFMIKIPVQRVSIHSEYSKKSYIAFKLNPIGMMPIMFATTVMLLPKMLLSLAANLFPDISWFFKVSSEMTLTNTVGICTYLAILILLTVLFSLIMIAPKDMAEKLQEAGDSLVGVYAGKQTRKYLNNRLLRTALFSGVVMAVCMGASLFLSYVGDIEPALALLPSSAMIFVSIGCNLVQEVASYVRLDAYRPFI